MIVLGVETTAHTFGVGIIKVNIRGNSKQVEILSNVKDMYRSETEGMVPDKVALHHNQVSDEVLSKAFKDANVSWKDVAFISYSAGPGLDPALWSGYHIAKQWAVDNNKKLVGINHCCAHLSIGQIMNKLNDPCYLYVSGVNTQIIVQEGGKYIVMGETLDIGLGNMLDKFGRIIGLGFPAGPEIEKMARGGKYVELPYTVKGMDCSFSGLLTKAKQLFERDSSIRKEDLCFSLQETSFAMLAEVVERAMAACGKKELLLVGGVGANKRFCEILDIMCKERGAKFYKVSMDLAGDQGAMIAWEGYLRQNQSGDMEVNPHWRADEV